MKPYGTGRRGRGMRRLSPATVIASVALFFSLAGTGLAAQHYLITSVSQIKPSVQQDLRHSVSVRQVIGSPVSIPSDDSGVAIARCPNNNEQVVAGSYWAQSPNGEAMVPAINYSGNVGNNHGWMITAYNVSWEQPSNPGDSPHPMLLRVIITCIST